MNQKANDQNDQADRVPGDAREKVDAGVHGVEGAVLVVAMLHEMVDNFHLYIWQKNSRQNSTKVATK